MQTNSYNQKNAYHDHDIQPVIKSNNNFLGLQSFNISSTSIMPWLMWGLATLFFAYQFVMRVTPGLLMPELIEKFKIDASQFGFFASMYYFGYAGMQIPIAMLLEKYGPKKVISLSALIAAVGTLLLIAFDDWWIALTSRFLIGAGSAAGFLGTSKVISVWFPKKMYAKMVGITFTFGLLGALYGGKPIGTLFEKFGFHTVILLVGLLGVILSILIFMIIKDNNESHHLKNETIHNNESPHNNASPALNENTNQSLLANLKVILLDPKLMLIAIANLLMVGSLEGFADVWGISYLTLARDIDKTNAALFTSTIFFGMLFGGPILAYLSDKFKAPFQVVSSAGFLMAGIFVVIILLNVFMGSFSLYTLLFVAGILCCYQVIVLSIGANQLPEHLSQLGVAYLNCINMLGGFFFHCIIGQCMDLFWNGSLKDGLRVYDLHAYQNALLIIPAGAFIGAIIFLVMKKKY